MNNYYITIGCENKSKIIEESIERATEHNTLGRDNQERFPSKKKRWQLVGGNSDGKESAFNV